MVSKLTTASKTSSPSSEIDPKLLNTLKLKCKDDNQALRDSFYYLSIDLKRKNGINRLRALQVIDILFQRSKLFRSIVADNVKLIAQSAGLLNTLSSSSMENSASTHTTEVENTVKRLLESWDNEYGSKYPQIHAVVRFCKETLGIQMPNVQANARRRTEEIAEQQLRVGNIAILQATKIVDQELPSTALQVDRIVRRVTECFAILFPRMGDGGAAVMVGVDEDVVDWDDDYSDVQWVDDNDNDEVDEEDVNESRSAVAFHSSDVLAGSVPYTLEISLSRTAEDIRTADNEVLLETIRELAGQLIKHVVPRLRQWREILRRAMDVLMARSNSVSPADISSLLGKRRLVSDSHDDRSVQQVEQFMAADHQLEALLRHVHDAATSKCRELFRHDSETV